MDRRCYEDSLREHNVGKKSRCQKCEKSHPIVGFINSRVNGEINILSGPQQGGIPVHEQGWERLPPS